MKVDFNNKVVKDYQGHDAELPNKEKQQVKDLVCKCLFVGGDGLSADEKYKAYKLHLKIRQSEESVELKSEDISLIKKVCDKCISGAGGYGQIVDLLEGEE